MTDQQWRPTVTDGGLETDLIFNRGVELPEFAAYPLLRTARGRRLLRDYFAGYASVAARAEADLLLETPTWRASRDWGARLGDTPEALAGVNRDAVTTLRDWGAEFAASPDGPHGRIRVVGMIGPRGDGYRAAQWTDSQSADYHRPQVEALTEGGADLLAAYTLTDPREAIGIVRAAREVGTPVAVSFTVETDGRLPDGTTLAKAVARVDQEAPPDHFLVNCAHPTHILRGLDDGPWRVRIRGVRVNASTASHAELDEANELDAGDVDEVARSTRRLCAALPDVPIVGGCCGTDVRHVAAMWGVGP